MALDSPHADVAQLVEHFTRNEGVRGSNPRVGSSKGPLGKPSQRVSRGARAARLCPGASVPVGDASGLGGQRGVEVGGRRRFDRGGAVGAGLPQRSSGAAQLRAWLLELGRADRADEDTPPRRRSGRPGIAAATPASRARARGPRPRAPGRPRASRAGGRADRRAGRRTARARAGVAVRRATVVDPAPRVAVAPSRRGRARRRRPRRATRFRADLERRRVEDIVNRPERRSTRSVLDPVTRAR